MAAFCLLVVTVGALSASALAIVPFGTVLIIACVVGIGVACMMGQPVHAVLLGALALFVSAQVGYGLGLGCRGVFGARRRQGRHTGGEADPQLDPTFHRFKTGK